MNKLKYLIRRIKSMDFKNMLLQAKVVRDRCGRPVLFTLIDMIYCGFKYLAGYMDYVVFEFYKLKAYQRKTQVTRGINNELVKTLNDKNSWYKFDKKDEFNRIFSDCLNRDWLDLSACEDRELESFLEKHPKVIVKPQDGACGRGVEKLCAKDFESSEAFRSHCIQNGQTLAEEIILQHEKMNELFPRCVNTVRMVTITKNEKVNVVFCSIRIGAGDTIVDNLNSGGMAALVDDESGVITTAAADKNGVVFEKHPDTGTAIRGFEIPYFKEGRELVERAALRVPEIGYVGWDIAFTPKGPLLIEGNHFPGHDIYQMPALTQNGIGVLPRFEKAIRG
ncbi:MAG: sugar-transfer associated ATP-grasp domain-containing protein [Oscillospiraceae bacterium]|nr:sugar-transfer associated ATP-grasp domain-containing protein [Oscillospiraceae bacterium]